jgi:PAS domain-containing protein
MHKKENSIERSVASNHKLMRYSLNKSQEEGMVLQLADNSIQACNSAAERILGIATDRMQEWISVNSDWFAENGLPLNVEEHPTRLALRNGKPYLKEIVSFARSPEQIIWLLLDAQPLFKANETLPYAVVTTFSDISAQKQLLQRELALASTSIIYIYTKRRRTDITNHFNCR